MINCDCTLDVPCQKPFSRPLPLFFPKSFSFFLSLLHDSADMPQVHRHRQPPATNATEMTDSEEIWPEHGEQNKTFFFFFWDKKVDDFVKMCTRCTVRLPFFIFLFIFLGGESEKPPSLGQESVRPGFRNLFYVGP